jgi:hydantoinase/carbamoylase family amidase
MQSQPDPRRVLRDLRALRAATSVDGGAQRVAFTPGWTRAREWYSNLLAGLPIETHRDAAGNLWSTLRGRSPRTLILGGHIDSVPNGGWLDGALDLLAGLEVVRRLASEHPEGPPLTVRLVDWADEEGARFGRSLFGSSACSGTLDLDAARTLRDNDGLTLPAVLAEHGIDFERLHDAQRELDQAAAYLELHIEQGPVLLDLGQPLGAVLGTFGVERHAITFTGQAAHSGSTPMARRRDAFLAAARLGQEVYPIAQRHGGVCTIGSCTTSPGIPTSVVAECRLTLDQRHLDPAALAAMWTEAREASERFAREGRVEVRWERLLRIDPAPFSPSLIELADAAIRDVGAVPVRLPSGPLHDASEMVRAGIPTAMLFVQSLHGISHNPLEDTREEHLELAVRALDQLVRRTLDHLSG